MAVEHCKFVHSPWSCKFDVRCLFVQQAKRVADKTDSRLHLAYQRFALQTGLGHKARPAKNPNFYVEMIFGRLKEEFHK